MIELFLAFLFKHFIIDFPLQRPFQYLNKGTYGHLGGVVHALLHGVGTFLIISGYMFFTLTNLSPMLALIIVWIDMVVHYHIDWAKVNLCKKFNLTPTTSEVYWWLLGLDQLLHYLTYVGIIYLIV